MGNGIVMRIHRVRAEFVVAACDEELLERELPIGTAGRTVKISSYFYGERPVSRDELLWALERATSVNLLGPRVLALAEAEGYVAPGGTGLLGGVPHAEIYTMPEREAL
jgi:uncharacterized protein